MTLGRFICGNSTECSTFLHSFRALILPEIGRIWEDTNLNPSRVAELPMSSHTISSTLCWFSSVTFSSYLAEMPPTERGTGGNKLNNNYKKHFTVILFHPMNYMFERAHIWNRVSCSYCYICYLPYPLPLLRGRA